MVHSLRMGRGQSTKGHIHTAISRARITQLFIIKPTSEKGGKFSVSSAKRKQLGLPDARGRASHPYRREIQKKRGGIRNS